jgi:hypothetical protein
MSEDALAEKIGIDVQLQRVMKASDVEREGEYIVLVVHSAGHGLLRSSAFPMGLLTERVALAIFAYPLYSRPVRES